MASTAPTGIDLRQFSPGRARSICSMGTPGCLDSRLPACLAMVGPIRRAGRRPGPGLHGLDAQGEQRSQGWRRVMTYISSLGGASGTLRKVQSRGTATTGPALAAFTADGRATHRRGQVFGPPEVGKGVRSRRLPTSVRCSIIPVIAYLSPTTIRPRNPAAEDPPVTSVVDHHQVHCRRRAGRPETVPCRR